jgi:hypothetical protein
VVFFHPHERRIRVCFTVRVTSLSFSPPHSIVVQPESTIPAKKSVQIDLINFIDKTLKNKCF